jgi:hypothetical protein
MLSFQCPSVLLKNPLISDQSGGYQNIYLDDCRKTKKPKKIPSTATFEIFLFWSLIVYPKMGRFCSYKFQISVLKKGV